MGHGDFDGFDGDFVEGRDRRAAGAHELVVRIDVVAVKAEVFNKRFAVVLAVFHEIGFFGKLELDTVHFAESVLVVIAVVNGDCPYLFRLGKGKRYFGFC